MSFFEKFIINKSYAFQLTTWFYILHFRDSLDFLHFSFRNFAFRDFVHSRTFSWISIFRDSTWSRFCLFKILLFDLFFFEILSFGILTLIRTTTRSQKINKLFEHKKEVSIKIDDFIFSNGRTAACDGGAPPYRAHPWWRH